MFTGIPVDAAEIQPLINHPSNAINLESNAHQSMNRHLAWGIEARSVGDNDNDEVRVIRICDVDPDMTLIVEILFLCR